MLLQFVCLLLYHFNYVVRALELNLIVTIMTVPLVESDESAPFVAIGTHVHYDCIESYGIESYG